VARLDDRGASETAPADAASSSIAATRRRCRTWRGGSAGSGR
jgi:hypothetical protein